MASVRIKHCGITSLDDAELCVDAGAWALGMILWRESPRACSLEEAGRITRVMRRKVELTGVFVNERLARVVEIADVLGLTMVQLHGDEGPSFCSEIARRTGAKVIKAMRISGEGEFRELERFHTDFHLLDTAARGLRGGTGETWDWALAARRRR